MKINFCGDGLSGFGDYATFQFWPNFPFRSWTIVHGVKIYNWLKKIMQVVEGVVKCMQTKFGGCGHSGFGDFATFQIWPFGPWTIVYGGNCLKKFM